MVGKKCGVRLLVGLFAFALLIGIAGVRPVAAQTAQERYQATGKKLQELSIQKIKLQREQKAGKRTALQKATDPATLAAIDAEIAKAKADRAAARAELEKTNPAALRSVMIMEIADFRVVPAAQAGMFCMEADIRFIGSGPPSGPVDILFHADTDTRKKAMAKSNFNIQSGATVTVTSDPFALEPAGNHLSIELEPYNQYRVNPRKHAVIEASLVDGKLNASAPVYSSLKPRAGDVEVSLRGGETAAADQMLIDNAPIASLPEMTKRVAEWMDQNPGRACFIEFNRATHYETLMNVRDALIKAGFKPGICLNPFFGIPLEDLGIDLKTAPQAAGFSPTPDMIGISFNANAVFFVPAESVYYVEVMQPASSNSRTTKYYGPLQGDLKGLMEKLRAWRPSVELARKWVETSQLYLEGTRKRSAAGEANDDEIARLETVLRDSQADLDAATKAAK